MKTSKQNISRSEKTEMGCAEAQAREIIMTPRKSEVNSGHLDTTVNCGISPTTWNTHRNSARK
nr:hypothetical protein [uncultured Undibacterium sp.]